MSDSLKINILTIPEEGLDFGFSGDSKWFKECLRNTDPLDFGLREVDVQCQILKTSSTIFIKGHLSVLLDINCSRCLENARVPLADDFAYTLVPAKAETKENIELEADELEIVYYSGDVIDLAPIICEQIILQVPIKPLCSEECKGLCPQCGINLNIAACNCHSEFVDDRFAVLKNIKINK